MTVGDGPVNIDKIIEGQIEISQSLDFLKGSFKKTIAYGNTSCIEYSLDIDEYTSVSAAMSIDLDKTVSTEYRITTERKDGFSLSTTMGVKVKNTPNNTDKNYLTIPDTMLEEDKKPSLLEKPNGFYYYDREFLYDPGRNGMQMAEGMQETMAMLLPVVVFGCVVVILSLFALAIA